jgi:hypothetical protein
MEEKTRNRALMVAALTCPCHVVLLPVLVAGTTLGAILEAYLGWFVAGMTMVFLAALGVASWKPQAATGATCQNGRCGADEAGASPMNSPTHEREDTWQAVARR